jgi:hypothetical protein
VPVGSGCNKDVRCCPPNRCLDGLCQAPTGEAPVDIPAPCTVTGCDPSSDPCAENVCNQDTGNCELRPLPGTSCETGNRCTADTCDANGQCQQGPETVTCPQCQRCNPETGTCTAGPDEVACEDGDLCTLGDTCHNGSCRSGNRTVCDQCQTCDSSSGACRPDLGQDNQTCDDGNACTVGDTCQTGVCVAGSLKGCDDNNECTADSCDPVTGTCNHEPLTNVPCETDNQCTANVCQNGVCTTGPAIVTCPPCHACEADTGTCLNTCTGNQTCQNGQCVSEPTDGPCGLCTDPFAPPDRQPSCCGHRCCPFGGRCVTCRVRVVATGQIEQRRVCCDAVDQACSSRQCRQSGPILDYVDPVTGSSVIQDCDCCSDFAGCRLFCGGSRPPCPEGYFCKDQFVCEPNPA